MWISIHALVKRATLDEGYFNIAKKNFNPRPREEGDPSVIIHSPVKYISIHALVKRATYSAPDTPNNVYAFQSTPS